MKNGVESLGRIRVQGIAILVLTFVVGVLVGFAGERVRNVRRGPRPFEWGAEMARRFPPGDLPPMFNQLNLTPEQRRQIADIMVDGRPRSDAVLDEMLPRLRAVTDSIRQEIRAVLTPEQAALWDSLEVRMRRGYWREGMPRQRRGPGGSQPPMP